MTSGRPTTTAASRAPASRRLPARLTAALADLENQIVTERVKGIPSGISIPLGEIGSQGWNVCEGHLPLPVMTLNHSAIEHNITLMQSYCDARGTMLAPHGKTTMAPQIFAEQLRAGAWAITVANVAQLQVCRSFGIPRVLFANEPVTRYEFRYIADQIKADPSFELFVLADSPPVIERLGHELRVTSATRPLNVLVELGFPGGRCGARDLNQLAEVADAVRRNGPYLRLAGVEGFEGVMQGVDAVDEYLRTLAHGWGLLERQADGESPFLVSAGGSIYFDRVTTHLGREALPRAQLVLRSGGYVTHDSGILDISSPMGSQSDRPESFGRLRPALEIWAAVLSRPEPDLVLVGMGRRDVPTDAGLPVVLHHAVSGGRPRPVRDGWQFVAVNDQHAYLRIPPGIAIELGDLVGSGISHPCTAFDRWSVVVTVDDQLNVTGAIRTFF